MQESLIDANRAAFTRKTDYPMQDHPSIGRRGFPTYWKSERAMRDFFFIN
jgi:hypothetical protein